jgi:hypothetical protein
MPLMDISGPWGVDLPHAGHMHAVFALDIENTNYETRFSWKKKFSYKYI